VRPGFRIALSLTVLVAIGGVLFWWRKPPPVVPTAARPVVPAVAATVGPPPLRAPVIRYPLPQLAGRAHHALPSLDDADTFVKNALVDLLGRKAVLSFLRLDGVVRRFVATVDNLGTDNAPAPMWPVNQTAGALVVESREGDTVISPKNADRYAGFVSLAEDVDTGQAARLYVRLYPLLQLAYEDLGYPGKYFNDRVVEVIDNLLATPAVDEPIKVKRVAIDGAVVGSGGLYLFDDPTLESRSAGQKVLLRLGHENAAKLKVKLTDFRRRIVVDAGLPKPGT
jgi:hypothetical protein